jgi:hypothetical protein
MLEPNPRERESDPLSRQSATDHKTESWPRAAIGACGRIVPMRSGTGNWTTEHFMGLISIGKLLFLSL